MVCYCSLDANYGIDDSFEVNLVSFCPCIYGTMPINSSSLFFNSNEMLFSSFSISISIIEQREAPIPITRTRTSHHGREIQPRRRFALQRVEGSNSLHLESRKRRTHRYLPRTQGYHLGSGSRPLFEFFVDRERRCDGKNVELRNRRMRPNLQPPGSGPRSCLVRRQQNVCFHQRPLCGT